jgi:hypothetical protein
MTAVSMVVGPTIGCAVVAKEHHTGMVSAKVSEEGISKQKNILPFRCVGKQVKQGVVIQKEVLRIPILGSNHIGALDRVSAEKDWLHSISDWL